MLLRDKLMGKCLFLLVIIVCQVLIFTPTRVEAKAKYSFKYATYAPAEHIFTKIAQEYANRLKIASEGQIEITVYPNGALCNAFDQFKSVAMGMVDMTDLVSDYMIGEIDMLGIGCLPFAYDWKKTHLIGEDARDIITKRLMQDNIQYLYTFGSGGNDIFLKKISLEGKPNFEGMKIRASGIFPIDAITAVGGVPVQMGTGDIYMAVETGLVNAAAIGVLSWSSNTLYDVLPVLYDVSITPSWFTPVINMDSFKRLPKDLQNMMIQMGREFAPEATKLVEEKRTELINWAVREKGCSVYTLTNDELNAIRKSMVPIQEKFIENAKEEVKEIWDILKKYQ